MTADLNKDLNYQHDRICNSIHSGCRATQDPVQQASRRGSGLRVKILSGFRGDFNDTAAEAAVAKVLEVEWGGLAQELSLEDRRTS